MGGFYWFWCFHFVCAIPWNFNCALDEDLLSNNHGYDDDDNEDDDDDYDDDDYDDDDDDEDDHNKDNYNQDIF